MWSFAGLVILGIAFGALFPVARRVHAHFDERRAVRGLVLGLGLAILALLPLAGALSTASDRLRERRLDEAIGGARPVLDAIARGVVGPADRATAGETLLALLRGDEVREQPRVRHQALDLRREGAARLSAEGNFPFLVMERVLRPGDALRYPVEGGDHVARVALAMPAIESGRVVPLEVSLLGAAGERRVLTLGGDSPRYHGWGETADLVEVRVLELDPPLAVASAVEVRATKEPVRLLGLCLSGSFSSTPLVPEETTRTGLPVRIAAGPSGRGVPIRPGAPPVEFTFETPVRCDRLWLVYEASDPKAAEYRWFGEDIIDVRLDYSDERPSEQHTLKHGEDLHSANLDRSRHSEDLQSSVALVWDEDGVRSHADQRLWVLSGERRLKRVAFRNLSGNSGYAVNLLGLTVGSIVAEPARPAPSADLFEHDGEQLRLRKEFVSGLEGVQLAFADRRGVVRHAAREGAAPLVGASLDPADAERLLEGKEIAAHCGSIVGIDADVAFVPVRAGDAVSGSLVFFAPERDRVWRRGKFTFIPIAATILAIPFFLVAFAESLARGERIRRKITVALAVAAIVPLSVVFLIVRVAFESARTSGEERRLSAQIQAVRERLVREREVAANDAATFFRAFLERPQVEPLFLAPPRPDAEATLRRELKLARDRRFGGTPSFVRLELRFPGAGGSPWRTIDDAGGGLALEEGEFQGTDYYCIRDRLVLVGVDRWVQGEIRGRLAVGIGVVPAMEKGRDVRFVGLDGIPIDGRSLPSGMESSSLASAIAGALRANRPALLDANTSEGLVDVFRDREGNPVFSFATIEPKGEGDVALFGLRTSLGTLLGFVAMLGAVGALGVARILTDRLTVPIERLAAATEEARLGRGVVPVTTSSTDEIGILTERFQAMSADLVRRIEHLDDLQRGMLGFAARLDREDVAREAVRFAAVASRAREAILLMPEGNRTWRAFESAGRMRSIRTTPLLGRILASGEWMTLLDSGGSRFSYLSAADRSLVGQGGAVLSGPIRLGRRDEGWLLLVFDRKPDPPQREAARAAAGSIAIVLENARTYSLAIEDGATGAFIAHHFHLRLAEAIDRAKALGRSLWVLRWRIVPSAGRAEAAERALVQMTRRLVRLGDVRGSGFVGRTGPLELTFALDEADPARRARLERSFQRISARFSASAGADAIHRIASFPADAPSAEVLLQRLRLEEPEISSGAIDLESFLGGPAPLSAAMRETVARAARLARVDIPVLLTGEPGVGKAWLAERMHRMAARKGAPLVIVHLAALSPNLAEAELFGVEVGAFSGADRAKTGLLEQANGGTLILDEVGETSPELQSKLLRVLQERRVRKLGGSTEIPLKFSLISTSTVELKDRIKAQRFRQDLYYRIAGAELHVPSLRSRSEDLPILAAEMLREFAPERTISLAPKALDRLVAHSWPGNLTELRGVIRRALLFVGERNEIDGEDLEIVRISVGGPTIGVRRLEGRLARGGDVRPGPLEPQRASGGLSPDLGGDGTWNARQRRLLAILNRGDRITTREYMELMSISPRTGLRDLDELVQKGKLRREGRKKGTSFRLI